MKSLSASKILKVLAASLLAGIHIVSCHGTQPQPKALTQELKINGIPLSMTIDQVVKKLGNPKATKNLEGKTVRVYPVTASRHFRVESLGNRLVKLVGTELSYGVTVFRVGDSPDVLSVLRPYLVSKTQVEPLGDHATVQMLYAGQSPRCKLEITIVDDIVFAFQLEADH